MSLYSPRWPAYQLVLLGWSALVAVILLGPGWAAPPARPDTKIVYLAGELSDSALIRLGSSVATQSGALLLLDSAKHSAYLRHFLGEYRPERVVAVGHFSEDARGLSTRLGVPVSKMVPWSKAATGACPLWHQPDRTPASVVVCTARPRSLLLRAAHLAAVEGGALWILGKDGKTDQLNAFIRKHSIGRIVAVGQTLTNSTLRPTLRLETAGDIEAAALRALGTVRSAVLVNPSDAHLSPLGPWLAASQRSALLLTNQAGSDVPQVVGRAGQRRALARLDTLTLLADLQSIPVWQRPNPIPADKDEHIDLEPLTPSGEEAFSYAIGRLFHEDRAIVALQLARGKLLAERSTPLRALVASNPGGGLSLLETISRNTTAELRNAGLNVTGLFGQELTGTVLRREMTRNELILWEGHHNTLVKDWGFVDWNDPLPPALVVMQSCLALQPEKMQPLLARGALGVVGTSTRTYSGSGGAFSLAYLNALLYEGRTLGEGLRSAKNFLVAYALLKKKRLGEGASRLGANQRAAWAFSLWGDPTYRLPRPSVQPSLTSVRQQVQGNTMILHLPPRNHDSIGSDRFMVQLPPGGRLAGLVRKNPEEARQPLVPLVFTEVPLSRSRGTGSPRLRSSLPDHSWVFLWDARRRSGYLLVVPPSSRLARGDGKGELRFHIDWPQQSAASDE